jgi:hypothetical protein
VLQPYAGAGTVMSVPGQADTAEGRRGELCSIGRKSLCPLAGWLVGW